MYLLGVNRRELPSSQCEEETPFCFHKFTNSPADQAHRGLSKISPMPSQKKATLRFNLFLFNLNFVKHST